MEKRISPAKPSKSVTFLRRGMVGTTVVYHVRNGEDKIYQTSLFDNGDYSCSHLGTRCMALQYGRKCYHVINCEQAEQPLTFGKYRGKTFSELPQSYIRWLGHHENRLAESHRWIAQLAKRWLVEAQQPSPVAEVRAPASIAAVPGVVGAPVAQPAQPATPAKPATRYKEDARGHLYYRPFSLLR